MPRSEDLDSAIHKARAVGRQLHRKARNRLTEISATECSLVDHAANGHTFLIAKNDEGEVVQLPFRIIERR
jgi:hypothetical protein